MVLRDLRLFLVRKRRLRFEKKGCPGNRSRSVRLSQAGRVIRVPPVREDPDREAVDAARNRDERAMETLYRRHHRTLYAYALRATQNPATSEEIVQDSFIRAFRGIRGFSGRSTFRTWLFTICVNRTRTSLKKQRPESVPLDETCATVEPATPRGWTVARLEQALGALPEGYREVVVMHDVLGMGHPEIAAARKCTVGTSKSQLHKARARLRDLLVEVR